MIRLREKLRFQPNVQEEVRAIEQKAAMNILHAIHRYAETGAGNVKALSGEFEGLLRLRVGDHRVFFDETADTITIHRIRTGAVPTAEEKTQLLYVPLQDSWVPRLFYIMYVIGNGSCFVPVGFSTDKRGPPPPAEPLFVRL